MRIRVERYADLSVPEAFLHNLRVNPLGTACIGPNFFGAQIRSDSAFSIFPTSQSFDSRRSRDMVQVEAVIRPHCPFLASPVDAPFRRGLRRAFDREVKMRNILSDPAQFFDKHVALMVAFWVAGIGVAIAFCLMLANDCN